MKQMQPEEGGKLVSHATGVGTVNEEMVKRRAEEIALINGRSPKHVGEADLEQARRELLGEEVEPSHSVAERVPESERWREVGHSVGHRAPTVPAHDEQTDTEKLVEEGIGEAEHDQMVEATRESLRKDTGH
jgi:hypothetical protein